MPKWTEYTSKDTLADNDEVMLYDATARANKRGLMSKFWDYVVDKMSTAVISKLETENKTVIGALNYLNGNKVSNSGNIELASNLAEDVFEKCKDGEARLFTIQSTVSISQGSPDGAGGFLLVYRSKTSSEYGIVVLFSYRETIWMKAKGTTWGEWKKIQLS